MTTDQIFKLIDAGYTKEEIEKMTMPDPEQPAPDPAPAEEPAEKPTGDPEPQPVPENKEIEKLTNTVKTLEDRIADMVRQMQSNNLGNASFDISPDKELEKRTDSAMAELIRPTIKKGE